MRSELLRPFGLAAAAVLSVLVIPWWVGRGITEQTRPTTAPANTRAADVVLAEWSFIDGDRGYDREEPYRQVLVYERRPLIRIFGDGRVQMSGDLMLGGGEMTEGRLSPQELERLTSSLAKFINGIEGRSIDFSIMQGYPWHEIQIDLGEGRRATMVTSMRVMELERWQQGPGLFSWRKDELWLPNMQDKTNRYEATLVRPTSFLAHRMIWTELEAEILRAAAQSILPDVNPRLPIERNPSPH